MRRNEALYGAIKAEVRSHMAREGMSGRTFEQLVLEAIAMDEDEYLASKGVSSTTPHFASFASPAGHLSGRAKRAGSKHHAQLLADWQEEANRLRTEYRNKVQSGELEPKGRMARMMDKAKGHPDRSDVQAARRVLAKHGLWSDAMGKAADERHEAVTTASMGSIGKDTRNLILASDYYDEERKR